MPPTVLDGNDRAHRFYERHGFVLDGGRRDDEMQGHSVPHVRFRLG